MDTRRKIVDAEAIPRDGRAHVVAIGYFDPVYADHVQRLSAAAVDGERLVVAIADPDDPLLPWRARAELVAGCARVDFVIHADHVPAGARTIDMREDDVRARRSLEEHVIARHGGA